MKENKDALKAIQEFADESPTRSDKLEQAKQLTRELYGEDGAEAERPCRIFKENPYFNNCALLRCIAFGGCYSPPVSFKRKGKSNSLL